MKSTLSKFAAASVASLAVLGSVAVAEPANAATVGTTCSTTNFIPNATACIGAFSVIGGNNDVKSDGTGDLLPRLQDGVFAGITDWTFDSKFERDGNGIKQDGGPNDLGVTWNGLATGSNSGTVSFANLIPALDNLVISLKAGSSYSAYFFEAGSYTVKDFEWVTSGVAKNNQGEALGLSHGSVFYNRVPTPALLPGLIGMGAAALRKRKGEGDESAEA